MSPGCPLVCIPPSPPFCIPLYPGPLCPSPASWWREPARASLCPSVCLAVDSQICVKDSSVSVWKIRLKLDFLRYWKLTHYYHESSWDLSPAWDFEQLIEPSASFHVRLYRSDTSSAVNVHLGSCRADALAVKFQWGPENTFVKNIKLRLLPMVSTK